MKLYFIRHAPTKANLSGSMVNGYECEPITLTKKPKYWESKVGKYIPKEVRKTIYSSPTTRCYETCRLLFRGKTFTPDLAFSEFDCKGLGDKKFWEVTKEEFEDLVSITPYEMQARVDEILNKVKNDCVIVSHGMLIRYIYHYFNGNKNISAYDIINSNGFRFSNLDLLVVDTDTMTATPHYFKNPIKHQ